MSGIFILPTISRPKNLERFVKSYREVKENAPIQLLLWANDPKIKEYLDLQIHIPDKWELTILEERFTAADAMRFCVDTHPDADYYGFLADDIIFHTKFSKRLGEAAYPVFVAYPDDGLQHEALCTHFVCGGELVRTLGWWALPGLVHSGIDLVWMLFGLNIKGMLKYCPDVAYEHIHPYAEKAPTDEIYEFAKKHLPEDNEVYQAWQKGKGLLDDVETLKETFNAAFV